MSSPSPNSKSPSLKENDNLIDKDKENTNNNNNKNNNNNNNNNSSTQTHTDNNKYVHLNNNNNNNNNLRKSSEHPKRYTHERRNSLLTNRQQSISTIFPTQMPQKVSKVQKIGNFKLGKTIGVGSFGKVKVAKHVHTGHQVAVKIINRKKIKSLRMDFKIKREITNMKLFRHPHIIKLYEVIETATDIFMIMEYVSGGEIFEHIVKHGRLEESKARHFFQQIISGVEYCHAHMVVHRDLKPENLLLRSKTEDFVKIADFGLSSMMHDGDFLKTSCGSPNYAAPEVISGKLYAGPEVDVWSCGVILYTLVCAKLPFDDEYIPSLFNKIRNGEYTLPDYLSESCSDLIKSMLVVDPLKRITISEIRKHPWFAQDIPSYLAEPAHVFSSSDIPQLKFDPEVINEISQNFSVSKEIVEKGLSAKAMNEFLVAYDLIIDNKNKHLIPTNEIAKINENSSKQFSTSLPMNLRLSENEIDEMERNFRSKEEEKPNLVYSYLSDPVSNFQAISPQGFGSPIPSFMTPFLSNPVPPTGPTRNLSISPNSLSSPLKQRSSKSKWGLGLFNLASKDADSLMKQVIAALKASHLEWKVTGPFQLKCRNINAESKNEVKLILQIYKVADQRYLVDIKNVEGQTFPLFETCSNLLKHLEKDEKI